MSEGHSRYARWTRAAGCVGLLVLGIAVYANADHERFFFDSAGYFIENPRTRDLPGSFAALFESPLRPDERFSHLTFALSHALNEVLGRDGFDVSAFLWTNALIHAVNACLVWALIGALARRAGLGANPDLVAFLAALVFLVHPIHGSSIAYIAQRRGLLAATFSLLAIIVYLWVRDRKGALAAPRDPSLPRSAALSRHRLRRGLSAAAVVLLAWLAVKSKSVALTLPVLLVTIELSLRATEETGFRRWSIRTLIPAALALAALAALFLWSQGLLDLGSMRIRPMGHAQTRETWTHLLTEGRVFVHYLGLLLLPLPQWLSIDHDFTISSGLWEHGAWAALLLHVTLIGIGVWAISRRHILLGIGILWFYATLAPYSLVPQTELKVEYKTYLPSVGITLCLASAGYRLSRASRSASAGVLAAIALALAVVTIGRNRIYQDDLQLWADAVAKAPNRLRPRIGLGLAYFRRDDLNAAAREYREAIRIAPDAPDGSINLSMVLDRQGRVDQALDMLLNLSHRVPESPTLLNNIGALLSRHNRWNEAVPYLREAVRLQDEFHEAQFNLAFALAQTGSVDEALRHYDRAIELRPRFIEAYDNKARLLTLLRRTNDAIETLMSAVQSNPDALALRMDLANALADAGRNGEAEGHYRELIRRGHEPVSTRTNLGTVLRAQGRIAEAIAEYEEALRLAPEHLSAWTNLGNARLSQKDYAGASDCYARVLTLNPEYTSARLGMGMVHFEQARPDLAMHEFAEAVRISPGMVQNHYYMGLCSERLGHWIQAIVHYDRALAIDPGHAPSTNRRRELAVRLSVWPP